jgi:hypothetical protein
MDKCQLNLTYGKKKKRGKKERREGDGCTSALSVRVARGYPLCTFAVRIFNGNCDTG